MAFKNRTESEELKILRILNTLMQLPFEEKNRYLFLEKGFEGELKFDFMTDKLVNNVLVLNDLQLEVNNTPFQIDTLIISQETLFPCEVKTHEGDYFYENERLYTINGVELQNPLDQLKRCETLFRQFLQKLNYESSIISNVIFINPTFTLYQSPLNKPIIYPTQLNRFLNEIDSTPSNLNDRHYMLANTLVREHKPITKFSKIPKFDYNQLRKGPTCKCCRSFTITIVSNKFVCEQCGSVEKIESFILRSVDEIKLLFPDMKVTTNLLFDWCLVIKSKKMIRRILRENFTAVGKRHFTYYI